MVLMHLDNAICTSDQHAPSVTSHETPCGGAAVPRSLIERFMRRRTGFIRRAVTYLAHKPVFPAGGWQCRAEQRAQRYADRA